MWAACKGCYLEIAKWLASAYSYTASDIYSRCHDKYILTEIYDWREVQENSLDLAKWLVSTFGWPPNTIVKADLKEWILSGNA